MLVSMLLIVSVSSFSQFRNSGTLKVRKKYPDVSAVFHGKSGGIITREELLYGTDTLGTSVKGFRIIEFTVYLEMNGTYYEWHCKGNKLTKMLLGKLCQLDDRRRFRFNEIIAESPSGTKHKLHPLKFTYRDVGN